MSQLNSVKLILLHLNEIIRYDTHVLKLKICSQLVINIFTRIIKTLQEQFQLQYI